MLGRFISTLGQFFQLMTSNEFTREVGSAASADRSTGAMFFTFFNSAETVPCLRHTSCWDTWRTTRLGR